MAVLAAARKDDEATSGSWAGRAGVARMRAVTPLRVPDPDRFRVEWRELVVDGMRLGEWRCTPMAVRTAARAPGTPPVVRLSVVVAGGVRYAAAGLPQQGGRGSVHFATDEVPVDLEYLEPTQLLTVSVPLSQLPDALRRSDLPLWGTLCPSTSTAGFMVLLEQVMSASRVGEASVHTVRAIRALVASVLLEHVAVPCGPEGDLRRRIVDHVEAHLQDPDLGPRSIALEFGISLRWVHHVFNTGDAPLARFIRDRRVDAVAEVLRTDPRIQRVRALALAHGFAGRDQLTRAFRARYGMTTNDYQDLAQRGLDLPAPRPGKD